MELKQKRIIIATVVMVLLLPISNLIRSNCRVFVFNATPSMPEGIYYLRQVTKWQKDMAVIFRLPHHLDEFASHTSWLKPNGWLIKRVGALEGDRVCIENGVLRINDERIGKAHKTDREGLPLPQLSMCQQVPPGYFFPLGIGEQSFDGRYIGMIRQTDVRGEGILILSAELFSASGFYSAIQKFFQSFWMATRNTYQVAYEYEQAFLKMARSKYTLEG